MPDNYQKEVKIPVKIMKTEDKPFRKRKRGFLGQGFRTIGCLTLILVLILAQSQILSAFEAFVISVTARIEDGIADYLVINKVYYDVDADHGDEIENEWIELYNPTELPIDISGWTIEDNTSSDIIPISDPIPALGFAIITGDDSTFEYWDIPDDVVKIVLADGSIGNRLSNDDDRVILRMPDGTEVDAMSYGGDTYAFDPSCQDVDEGHMLGRDPNGFDTNKASNFKDMGLPSVEVLVPNGGEVWYVGRIYTLEWTAENPTGEDSALSIDIWYSADSGATWANIVRGTENDGAFDWRAPLLIDDYYVPSDRARIKVAATGPGNFMVQDWDMSDNDFCPPIDYFLLTPEELLYLAQHELTGVVFGGGSVENPAGQEFPEEQDTPKEPPAEENPPEEILEPGPEPEPVVEEIPIIEEEPVFGPPDIDGVETTTPLEEGIDFGGDAFEKEELIEELIEGPEEIVFGLPDIDTTETTTPLEEGTTF